jgi:hypothetical protein
MDDAASCPHERRALQYAMRNRVTALGWSAVEVVASISICSTVSHRRGRYPPSPLFGLT